MLSETRSRRPTDARSCSSAAVAMEDPADYLTQETAKDMDRWHGDPVAPPWWQDPSCGMLARHGNWQGPWK